MPPSGNSPGWRSAQLISELIFGPKTSPLPSGTLARSRGIETIDTVRPTGSSDTTISESVNASVRPGAESTPIRRTFRRSLSGGGRALEIERTAEPRRSGRTSPGPRSRSSRPARAAGRGHEQGRQPDRTEPAGSDG